MKKEKLSARGLEIEFEDGLSEEVTAHAGVALLVEVGRLSGVIAAADRALPTKKNPKGLTHGRRRTSKKCWRTGPKEGGSSRSVRI